MRIILASLIIAVTFAGDLYSQIEKGTLTIGGSIYGSASIINNEDYNSKSLSLQLGPKIGIFLVENFEIGISPSVLYSRNVFKYSDFPDSKLWSISPSLNLYCNIYFGTETLKPYLGLGISSVYTYNKSHSSDSYYETFNAGGNLKGGLAFFIRDYVSIDMIMSYNLSFYKSSNDLETRHSFYLGTGIKYFLLRK